MSRLFLCVVVILGVLASVDGFGVTPKGSLSSALSENNRRRSSLRYLNDESPTSSVPRPTDKEEESEATVQIEKPITKVSDQREWDLREDWALQDSVPRYTVGAESATFWTQLRHSTPELEGRSEAELEARYKEWYSESEDLLLVECGPSPILLSDWRVTTAAKLPSPGKTSTPTTTMMSGSLPNGSQIWFPLKCAGTLGDDSLGCASTIEAAITQDTLDDCFISASMTMHTSSYAESTGGVVYELGAPRCEAHKIHGPRVSLAAIENSKPEEPVKPTGLAVQFCDLQKNFVSAAAKNVGTIQAIIAASTLSASLAMGYSQSQVQTIPQASPSVTQNRQGDIVASRSRSSPMVYSTTAPELSIGEKRARAELRVGSDKRSLVRMQQRLAKDQAMLNELRQEEFLAQSTEMGM